MKIERAAYVYVTPRKEPLGEIVIRGVLPDGIPEFFLEHVQDLRDRVDEGKAPPATFDSPGAHMALTHLRCATSTPISSAA